MNKVDFIKILKFCSLKYTFKRMKQHDIIWKTRTCPQNLFIPIGIIPQGTVLS